MEDGLGGKRAKRASHVLGDFLHVRAHERAPLFEDKHQARLYFGQLASEVGSRSFSPGKEVTELLRQASLVNLWFFLKFICGSAGPYDKLNAELNLDMCNFRQSEACMGKKARGAAFLFRSSRKSTVLTHGADTWEIVREPDIKIAIVNATLPKAKEFMGVIRSNFERNELMELLFPEWVPRTGAQRWNNDELVSPARTRYMPDPTVKPLGAGGAAEGGHFDLLNADDLVGLDDLGVDMNVSMDMFHKIKWWKTNHRALLNDLQESRIVAVGTRYSADDVWQLIVNDAKEVRGYQDQDMLSRVSDEGQYTIYYRMAIEDGVAVAPEIIDKKELEKMAQEDFWTYTTQYLNNPQQSGLSEFNDWKIKKCMVVDDSKTGSKAIVRFWPDGTQDQVFLKDMDCVMSIDPAGTDTGITAKTSRTSIGIWAMDYEENVYRIWGRVGYFDIGKLFDYVFEGNREFKGYLRQTVVESNAMQKIIAPLLSKEQWERREYISPKGVPAKGDKVARIRSSFGLYLSQGKVWTTEAAGKELVEEQMVFPMSRFKMDVLDEADKGITALRRPFSPGEVVEAEIRDMEREMYTTSNVVGY